MERQEPSPVRMMVTLGVAGVISGSILVGIYLITAPVIAANRAAAIERAIYEVLPGASQNVPYVVRAGALVPWEGAGGGAVPSEEAVYGGFDARGGFVGYAIPAAGAGFQDTITLIFGYRPVGARVIGMRVLESRETPGLGDKIIKDAVFVGRFDDLAVAPPAVVTKKGATREHEVDAISGATISAVAVVRIINQAVARWTPLLAEELPSLDGEGDW